MTKSKDFLLDELVLTKIAKSFEEPISNTFGINMKKEAKVVHKNILYHVVGDSLNYDGAQYVDVNGDFTGKVKGAFHFLLPTGEALNIGGTMMMLSSDGLFDFINKGFHADAEDAIKEVVAQLISQVATVLRVSFKDINYNINNIKNLNILENLKEFEANVEGDELVFLVYEITLKGEESFLCYFVLSKEIAFSIAPLENAEGMPVNSSDEKSLNKVSKEELEGNVEMLRRIKVPVIVTLAQKRMTVEEIIKHLSVGSIIEFNVAFDSYLDLQIGDKKIGEGEVVTVNEVYGLQIKSILSARETLETLL